MKRLFAISLCVLALAACNWKADVLNSVCLDSIIPPYPVFEGNLDDSRFPDYPNPQYLEFFLKSDGCYYNEDTLNILLSTEASIDGLPKTICGIQTRYFKHWDDVTKFFGERIIGVEILEFGYEIKKDINDNPRVFIGVYNCQKFGPEDCDWSSCHDFEEQDYLDSVMNFPRTK